MDLAKKQENVFRWCNNLYLCAKIYNNIKKLVAMRKITFFLMFMLFAFVLKANDGVMLTLKAEPG